MKVECVEDNNMKVECDICGAAFKPGNTDGVPNGIGLVLDTGKTVNVCYKCLIKAPTNEDIIEKLKKAAEE